MLSLRIFLSTALAITASVFFVSSLCYSCPKGKSGKEVESGEILEKSKDLQVADDEWDRYDGNPVFVKGNRRQWDAAGITCFVVKHFPWSYMMWYTTESKFGLATSRDGIDWVRRDSPVFVPDSGVTIWGPEVLHDGDIYHMWYVSRGPDMDGICHATSEDGVEWTKSGNNPVVSSGGCHAVIWDGEQYRMFIQAQGFRLAYSDDGDEWTDWDDQEVVFESGRRGDWDEIMAAPSVAYYEDQLHLWYTGADTIGNARGEIAIGHSTSDDWGETWNVPDDRDDMREIRPIEEWTRNIYSSGIDYDGENVYVWYAGTGGTGGFGYAWRPVNAVAPETELKTTMPSLWTVSPNPTSGQVRINYLGTLDFPVTVNLIDLNGRKVFNQSFSAYQPIRIDPGNHALPIGQYTLHISSDKKDVFKNLVLVK